MVQGGTPRGQPPQFLADGWRPRLRGAAALAALLLVCAPATVAAIAAFPLWDDAAVWLLIREQGTSAIAWSHPDRPVMARLWVLLGASEPVFWVASFAAQAVLWPVLRLRSARWWTLLFPVLDRYAPLVACLAVSPVIVQVRKRGLRAMALTAVAIGLS